MYQILFTFLLVRIQTFLEQISLFVVKPGVKNMVVDNKGNTNDFPTVAVQCISPHYALLIIKHCT